MATEIGTLLNLPIIRVIIPVSLTLAVGIALGQSDERCVGRTA